MAEQVTPREDSMFYTNVNPAPARPQLKVDKAEAERDEHDDEFVV